jgi:hypothetical protein
MDWRSDPATGWGRPLPERVHERRSACDFPQAFTPAEGTGLEHTRKTREIQAFPPEAVQIPVQLPI